MWLSLLYAYIPYQSLPSNSASSSHSISVLASDYCQDKSSGDGIDAAIQFST